MHLFHPQEAESPFARPSKVDAPLPARRILSRKESPRPSGSETRLFGRAFRGFELLFHEFEAALQKPSAAPSRQRSDTRPVRRQPELSDRRG